MVHITTGEYKGLTSVTIENETISVVMIPELGAKLVSIVYKLRGKEWMLDSGSRPMRGPVFGSTFTDWDMSGWDECFPTINACLYAGIELPDHGELWSLPWTYTLEENSVVCTVSSPLLPYRFTRRISFSAPDRIRLDYRVDNDGDETMPFLWVPHPQFAITEPTTILLPERMQEMLCVYEGHALKAGQTYTGDHVSNLAPIVTGDARKFYYPDRVSEGWSGLIGDNSGDFLLVSVPPDKVPYLGVWIDHGMFNDRVTCALEPSIGYYDSLQTALDTKTAQVIPGNSSFEWHLEMTLGNGDWLESLGS